MASLFLQEASISPTGVVALIGGAAFLLLMIISLGRIFEKAGKPGWAAMIPIYNIIVLHEVVGRPRWWVVLWLIPIVIFIAAVIVYLDLARSFGKTTLFGAGMLLLPFIFIPLLAFGDAQYRGFIHDTGDLGQ
jgi:hypothetical protein